MSFTTTVYNAQTKQPISENDDPSAYNTYGASKCDLDGSVVHFQQSGGPLEAHCQRGHRWIEVETLDATTGERVSEGASWRQLE